MKKMIYAPDGLFGIDAIAPPPIEVDVIELGDRFSRIRKPLSPDCFINIMRKQRGNEPLEAVELEVLSEWLQPIQ